MWSISTVLHGHACLTQNVNFNRLALLSVFYVIKDFAELELNDVSKGIFIIIPKTLQTQTPWFRKEMPYKILNSLFLSKHFLVAWQVTAPGSGVTEFNADLLGSGSLSRPPRPRVSSRNWIGHSMHGTLRWTGIPSNAHLPPRTRFSRGYRSDPPWTLTRIMCLPRMKEWQLPIPFYISYTAFSPSELIHHYLHSTPFISVSLDAHWRILQT